MSRLLLIILFIFPAYSAIATEYDCKVLHVYKWKDGQIISLDSSNLIQQLLPLKFNDKSGVLGETKYRIIHPLNPDGELVAQSRNKMEIFRLKDEGKNGSLNFLNFDGIGLYTGVCGANNN